MNDTFADDRRTQKFVSLLTANQGRIYAYVLSLVTNYNDADDIMQEASGMMWRKFSEFELGTDFLAWALTIAYYRVLEFRKRKKRQSRIQFNEKLVADISDRVAPKLSDIRAYSANLRDCVKKLRKRDIDLLRMRYWDDLPVKDISSRIGRTSRNIYYELSRVQELLLRCIQRDLSV